MITVFIGIGAKMNVKMNVKIKKLLINRENVLPFRLIIFAILLSSSLIFGQNTPVITGTVKGDVQIANGIVFHDVNGTGTFDLGRDEPLAGVAVSNGRDIVVTDERGRYELPVNSHTIIFVIKPRGWMVPVSEINIPLFYYIHSPDGATGTRYKGLDPTIQLPESIDFPLYPQNESNQFNILLFADTQTRDLQALYDITHDVVTELIDMDTAIFGLTLGDIVNNNLTIFDPLNEVIAKIGIPWWNIIGNHDIDYTPDNNTDARGVYYKTYGPTYYSFSWGPAHFIVLDDIRLIIDGDRHYRKTGFGDNQLNFLRSELARIDKDQLTILMMHIPPLKTQIWEDNAELKVFYELLANRPNILLLSGHKHSYFHHFISTKDGFAGDQPLHLIGIGAVCGYLRHGTVDDYGLPNTMMGDGTPNGYAFLHINGNKYKLRWKAARRSTDFQMHIYAPESVTTDETLQTKITVNIFSALPDAHVEMRVGDSAEWTIMNRTTKPDPVRIAIAERKFKMKLEWKPNEKIVDPHFEGIKASTHLWEAEIGRNLNPGMHVIYVRAKDKWWVYDGRRIIHIKH